jgi:hypothetical protein
VRKLAIGFWAAQALAALVMLWTAAAIHLESILWTGPTLTIVGLLHAVVTLSLGSWVTLVAGLSGPLVCAFIAVCIALFNWSPGEAEGPVIVIMSLYTVIFFPVTAITLRPGIKWDAKSASPAPPVWQFSLKSLLLSMTAICLLIVAAQQVSTALRDDDIIFNGFALVTVALCGLVVWRFVVYRRRVMESRYANMPLEFHRPAKRGCEGDI